MSVAEAQSKPGLNKADFLCVYATKIAATYPWAQKKGKLDAYVNSVSLTINGEGSFWSFNAKEPPAVLVAAWVEIGGKGKVTMQKLRELP